jgi:hypothetical protein
MAPITATSTRCACAPLSRTACATVNATSRRRGGHREEPPSAEPDGRGSRRCGDRVPWRSTSFERTPPFGGVVDALDPRRSSADPRRAAIGGLLAGDATWPATAAGAAPYLRHRIVEEALDPLETSCAAAPWSWCSKTSTGRKIRRTWRCGRWCAAWSMSRSFWWPHFVLDRGRPSWISFSAMSGTPGRAPSGSTRSGPGRSTRWPAPSWGPTPGPAGRQAHQANPARSHGEQLARGDCDNHRRDQRSWATGIVTDVQRCQGDQDHVSVIHLAYLTMAKGSE